MSLTEKLTLILGSSGISAVITSVVNRRKNRADVRHTEAGAADIITQASQRAVEILAEQLEALNKKYQQSEARADHYEAELATARELIHILEREVSDLKRQLNPSPQEQGDAPDGT